MPSLSVRPTRPALSHGWPTASSRRDGSTILLILLLTTVVGTGLASLFAYSLTERRLNQRHALRLEAKAAAEATVEHGFAELVRRFERRTSFPSDSLAPRAGRDPLRLPPEFYAFFGGTADRPSRVVLPSDPAYDPFKPWGTYATELVGGVVPPGEWKFIDPRVPGNDRDRLAGRWVFVREVRVYGKASVRDPLTGDLITAHASQDLQVRDAPLFSHAIFYNMDLEIAPGPAMTITGGVHANGDLYVQSGTSLDFLKQVTATGRLLHGRKPGSGQSLSTSPVRFVNASGTQVPMLDGTRWLDSRLADWAALAMNRWHGSIQSAEMQVQPQRLIQIPDFIPDNPATSGVRETRNHAYRLIQPSLPTDHPQYDPTIEEQKFSTKAGLTARVVRDVSAPGGYRVDLVTYERAGDGAPVIDPATRRPREIPLAQDPSAPFARVVRTPTAAAATGGEAGGLRDRRRGMEVNLVVVDVARLKTAVEEDDGLGSTFGDDAGERPRDWWNGIVYVDLPLASTSTTREDGVTPSIDGFGVKLTRGGSLPNPEWARARDVYGMTVATNNVLYVEGHYNADGSSSTGSATSPDAANVAQEPPAALAADAITFLSSGWNDATSFTTNSPASSSFTEVSAALLTGQVLTNDGANGRYSGGVENFPRFLENWSGKTFRYRGSMVALFQSEVATQPWGSGYYSPPNRNWGFHELFAQGFYPPGTPNTRSFRRVDFRDLSRTAYQVALTQLEDELGL